MSAPFARSAVMTVRGAGNTGPILVVQTDIAAGMSAVHAIDGVILPRQNSAGDYPHICPFMPSQADRYPHMCSFMRSHCGWHTLALHSKCRLTVKTAFCTGKGSNVLCVVLRLACSVVVCAAGK